MSETKTVNEAIIPIIGRPNVGKSTLFNALVGEKRAVTGPEPGVTRDRVTSTLDWEGRMVTLVDTAGFQKKGSKATAEFIVRQVEKMIDQGEFLLFVVDAKTGPTALDLEIARKLRPCSQRVLVVINKVDPGYDLQQARNDFYRLGFPHMVPVSAEHKRNLDALRNITADELPEVTYELPTDGIRLALLGRPNVGKSTLFNSILGYERVMVSEEAGTTRDVVDISFEVDEQRYHLVDTVGLRRKARVDEEVEVAGVYQTIRAINFCDVGCLLLDWKQRVTKQDQCIAGLIADRYRGCMILVNKADEMDEAGELSWRRHINERFHFLKNAPLLFTSGLHRRGLQQIFNTTRKIYEEVNRNIPEEKLFNAFLDIKGQISWPSSQARGVILEQIKQLDVNPITFAVKTKRPRLLTPPDLRHLRRLLRKNLDLYLCPIKLIMLEKFDEK